jgi:hypothetical protein
MPSLRDVTHEGWLCTFNVKQQLGIPSVRSWAAPVRATVWKKAGGMARLSRTKSLLPGHSPRASQAGRCAAPTL